MTLPSNDIDTRRCAGPVATSLDIDQFQEMTTAPNGDDVLWAHSKGGQKVNIHSVAACKLAP